MESTKFIQGFEIAEQLRKAIDNATCIKIAVAFLKEGGLEEIASHLENALAKGNKVEFVVGACPAFHITEPSTLRKLKALEKRYSKNMNVGFFHKGDFHPKIFIFINDKSTKAIIGSSNLTSGGIGQNIEANILLERNLKDSLMEDIISFYDLEIMGASYDLSEEFIGLYEKSFDTNKKFTFNSFTLPLLKPKRPPNWENYPFPKRKLSETEKVELRKKIAKISSVDWVITDYYTLGRDYRCNANQIKGIKAWVHNPSSWSGKKTSLENIDGYRLYVDEIRTLDEDRRTFDKRHHISKYSQGWVYSRDKDNKIDGIIVLWYKSSIDNFFPNKKRPFIFTRKQLNTSKLRIGMDVYLVENKFDPNSDIKFINPRARAYGKLTKVIKKFGEKRIELFLH